MRIFAATILASIVATFAATSSAEVLQDSVVSSALPQVEQNIIETYLRQMPSHTLKAIAMRDPKDVLIAVVDDPADVVYVNRPEFAGAYEFVDREAKPIWPPLVLDRKTNPCDPGYTANTGPYRRIYTKCLRALPRVYATNSDETYFTRGDVSITCKAGSFNQNPSSGVHEAGFAYLGGWSGTPNAPYGNVDAGLQYNYELTPSHADNYSPFLSASPAKYVHGTGKASHIACTPTEAFVQIQFDVYPCFNDVGAATTCLELDALTDEAGSKLQLVVYPIPVTGSQSAGPLPGGWGDLFSETIGGASQLVPETPCRNCVFKWMSSIGQTKHANYDDGSWYIVEWADRAISCRATGCKGANSPTALSAGEINCSEYPFWYGIYDFGTRDCTSTPAGQTGQEQTVNAEDYAPSEETDDISLTFSADPGRHR